MNHSPSIIICMHPSCQTRARTCQNFVSPAQHAILSLFARAVVCGIPSYAFDSLGCVVRRLESPLASRTRKDGSSLLSRRLVHPFLLLSTTISTSTIRVWAIRSLSWSTNGALASNQIHQARIPLAPVPEIVLPVPRSRQGRRSSGGWPPGWALEVEAPGVPS